MSGRSVLPLIAAVALAAASVAFGWALPGTSVVERADDIAAAPETVYRLLTDLRFDRRWSPWRDAHAHYLLSGPPSGVGAAMEWTGRTRGSARIERAEPYSLVVQRLSLDGRQGRSEFRLTRSAEGTRVSWRFEREAGANPLVRWGNFLSSQATGVELERGLDRLEDIAEALLRPEEREATGPDSAGP